jgi:hypothetical protein
VISPRREPLSPLCLPAQVVSLLRCEAFVVQLLPRLAAEEEREDAAIAAVLPDGGAFRREARPEAEQRGEVAEAARIAEKPSARPLVKSALHAAGAPRRVGSASLDHPQGAGRSSTARSAASAA